MPRLKKPAQDYLDFHGGGREEYSFHCPGCKYHHRVIVKRGATYTEDPEWTFNNNLEKPTFYPSILVNRSKIDPSSPVCHSFVKDGQIQFLNDCDHALAGQTVELPEIKE